jgi:hypothetical protein
MAGLTYAYDATGRLTSATYPDGTVVAYGASVAGAVPVAPPAPAGVAKPPTFCVRCGAKLAPGAGFCVKCGGKVG